MFPLSASAPAADSMDQHTTMISSPTSNAASGDATPPEPPLCVCMVAAMPFPTSNGTSGSVREMAEALAGRGHEVHVVTYHFGQDIPVRGVHLHRITPLVKESSIVVGPTVRKPLYDLQIIFKTLAVIRRYRPALLHAHCHESAYAAGICRLLTGIPVLYSGHNSMADELPTFKFFGPRWAAVALGRVLDGIVLRCADRLLPHSANMEQILQGKGHGRTEPMVPFGINFDDVKIGDSGQIRQRYGLGEGPVVLYSGMMARFQRLDLLLEAMTVVVREFPSARLFVVRTIECRELAAEFLHQAEQLGLAGHVVLTAPQPLHAVHELLAAGDVTVAPRPRLPGFPIKLLNYMAARKASVLFASTGCGLVHGQTVFLAEPDTGDALGKAIAEVLRDCGLRQRLAQQGYDFARANYDSGRMAARLGDTYLRTLQLTRRPGAMRWARKREARASGPATP